MYSVGLTRCLASSIPPLATLHLAAHLAHCAREDTPVQELVQAPFGFTFRAIIEAINEAANEASRRNFGGRSAYNRPAYRPR